jgi:hypothetical protein
MPLFYDGFDIWLFCGVSLCKEFILYIHIGLHHRISHSVAVGMCCHLSATLLEVKVKSLSFPLLMKLMLLGKLFYRK